MSGVRVTASPPLDRVRGLLDAENLPSSDIDEALLEHFFAGRSNGTLIGVIGLEPHGRAGLLRSLVVDGDHRAAGVGRVLVEAVEGHAAALGVETLYLLTTTAADYFRRLGYRDCARDTAPPAIRGSREFSALCPADAAFLCKRLATGRLKAAGTDEPSAPACDAN